MGLIIAKEKGKKHVRYNSGCSFHSSPSLNSIEHPMSRWDDNTEKLPGQKVIGKS